MSCQKPLGIPQKKDQNTRVYSYGFQHAIFSSDFCVMFWSFHQMCKRYPGFLRVSLQDPQPERRFLRRGWVTFDRTVNINNICWNLNNIRVGIMGEY